MTDYEYDWQMHFNQHQFFVMRLLGTPLVNPLLSSFSNNTQLILFLINVTFLLLQICILCCEIYCKWFALPGSVN